MQKNQQAQESSANSQKLKFSLLKYLWLSVPTYKSRTQTIPAFLSQVESLQTFSLLERNILANHLHLRKYNHHERIFKQGDRGLGIYFILSGCVSIWASDHDVDQEILHSESKEMNEIQELKELKNENITANSPLVILKQFDQFGEISLVQDNAVRTASALAQGPTELLALFRPDLEDLMANSPVVASKILLGIAQVMAYRMTKMASDIRSLKILLNQQGVSK